MSKKAVVFGAHGGIGQATTEQLLKAGYVVIPIHRQLVDFTDANSYTEINTVLDNYKPDVVVNCAGYFDNTNTDSHTKTFDINIGSNWAIVQHYVDNDPKKPVSITFVGSSAHKAGKKNYMMYSASKAALHNLWEGSRDFFAGSNITVNIVHPVRTRTNMVAPYDSNLDYLDPAEVAETIVELAQLTTSNCREISFKE